GLAQFRLEVRRVEAQLLDGVAELSQLGRDLHRDPGYRVAENEPPSERCGASSWGGRLPAGLADHVRSRRCRPQPPPRQRYERLAGCVEQVYIERRTCRICIAQPHYRLRGVRCVAEDTIGVEDRKSVV